MKSRKIDEMRERIEKKYEPQVNNPGGNNKYTKKKDLVKKAMVLSEIQQFEGMDKGEQYQFITKRGNELWREGKEYRDKRSKFTVMQKIFFGWDFK